MESEVLKWLAVGGDVGIYVVLFIFWKIDRRLFKLETEKSFVQDIVEALERFAHTVKMRGN